MSSQDAQISELPSLNDVPKLRARRQLSVVYEYNGNATQDDPSAYTGAERTKRENALLTQQSGTGYANSIRAKRNLSFFTPFVSGTDFLNTLTDLIIEPPVLLFKSFYYFFEAMFSALDSLVTGCCSLIAMTFDRKLTSDLAHSAVESFAALRDNLSLSLVHAVCSVYVAIHCAVKLLTRSASTLVHAITEPQSEEDEENTSCFSCN